MAGLVSTRPSAPRQYCRGVASVVVVLGLLACGGLILSAPAHAQDLQFPSRPPPPKKSPIAIERERTGQKQMLVQAKEVDYDYANNRVAAVGNVQIYYGDSTLEADRVIYDQKTKRLHAEGNVRLTEQNGKVTYGEIMDLSDDYRLRGLAAARRARADTHGCHARRTFERQLHGLSQRRLHRLRAVQGRPEKTTSLAGEGRTHHP